jgi:hypothetical protein
MAQRELETAAAPMRLWRVQRVEAAEAAPEFGGHKARADRRCTSARQGAEVKAVLKALGG